MKQLVSVVVLNWNGQEYLRGCLDSVLSQDYDPIELIVVDNGSTDGSVELIREYYPTAMVIENAVNRGFAAGNNIGIRHATGEYIVILNNDAEMEPGCVSEMKSAIGKDPRYGACASKIYLKGGQGLLDAAGIAICPDGLSIGRGRLERGEYYDREEEVFFGSGCCMMCKREMLEDVRIGDDYFDESFFMYADDTDLGWRAALRGWKCIYSPNAKVHHMHSASSDDYSPLKAFLVERNRMWIQAKCFPFLMMLYGQFYTSLRYFFQAFGAFTGKGAAGSFAQGHSKAELIKILFRVWGSALAGLPGIWKKRRTIQGRRTVEPSEIRSIAKTYGVKAREIAMKG